MKESDRKKIYETLVGKMPADADELTRVILEDCAQRETEALAPIIDAMLLEAIRGTYGHGCAAFKDPLVGLVFTGCYCGLVKVKTEEEFHKHLEQVILSRIKPVLL